MDLAAQFTSPKYIMRSKITPRTAGGFNILSERPQTSASRVKQTIFSSQASGANISEKQSGKYLDFVIQQIQ